MISDLPFLGVDCATPCLWTKQATTEIKLESYSNTAKILKYKNIQYQQAPNIDWNELQQSIFFYLLKFLQ